jgi:putative heme-binding domain-containing protein
MGMLNNMPNQQNIHYAYCLRNVRYGWSLEQRRTYFSWFTKEAKTKGGNSFQGFLSNIRKEALANCSVGERAAVADITGEKLVVQPIPSELPTPKGPGHKWNYDEILKLVGSGLTKRDFENGKRTFNAAKCVLCHRFDGSGGSIGPDLTGVVSRFSYRDLLENIIEPSKVISDQYESEILDTLDGIVTGRVVGEDEKTLTVLTDAYKPSKLTVIKKADVDGRRKAKSSIMPGELLNTLNKDEVLDLIAYMMSRGNKADKVFR